MRVIIVPVSFRTHVTFLKCTRTSERAAPGKHAFWCCSHYINKKQKKNKFELLVGKKHFFAIVQFVDRIITDVLRFCCTQRHFLILTKGCSQLTCKHTTCMFHFMLSKSLRSRLCAHLRRGGDSFLDVMFIENVSKVSCACLYRFCDCYLISEEANIAVKHQGYSSSFVQKSGLLTINSTDNKRSVPHREDRWTAKL